MKKVSLLQRVKNRALGFCQAVKAGMSNTIRNAGMIISLPSMFKYPIVPMLIAPILFVIAATITIVGSLYSLVKGVVTSVTRKPVYDMSDQMINSKLQLLEKNRDLSASLRDRTSH